VDETNLDPGENFILSKGKYNDHPLILGSIYGPNEHNPDFFRSLYNSIVTFGDNNIIIGGDFNCTPSADNVNINLDCHNMTNLPNVRHSIYINEFCLALDIHDPFHQLWPNKKKIQLQTVWRLKKESIKDRFFLNLVKPFNTPV
jgi:hypothetical protein